MVVWGGLAKVNILVDGFKKGLFAIVVLLESKGLLMTGEGGANREDCYVSCFFVSSLASGTLN
jgi:hypothetical protein